MRFFGKDLGLFKFTTALSKLTIVFTNAEGTFLRRNMFVVFGLCDFLAALCEEAAWKHWKKAYPVQLCAPQQLAV